MSRSFLWLFIGCFAFVKGAEIENSRVIITGGANGIGYACVHDLLSRGAQVVAILDIDVVNGSMAAQRFNEEFGEGRVLFFPTDVSDPFQFESMSKRNFAHAFIYHTVKYYVWNILVNFMMVVQLLGGLDIMINDAGIANDAIWEQEIDTNLKGEIQGTLMSFDVMGKHKGGRGGTVVNIASDAGLKPFKYFPVYAGTKNAIIGFSRSIALSYDVTGVAVKTMCPGDTNTQMVTSKAHRFLDVIDYDEAIEALGNLNLQEPEDLSKEMMRFIEEAPNGAIWVVEKDKPTISLDIPNYREWGTPV